MAEAKVAVDGISCRPLGLHVGSVKPQPFFAPGERKCCRDPVLEPFSQEETMSHPRPRFGSSGRHVPALSPSSCLLVLAILFTSISAWSAQPAITTGEVGDNLLRFTSAGHALGFGHDSFYVVGADRFLRVEHVGGRPVRPVAEGLETSPDGMPALGMVTYFGAWDGVDVVYKAAPNGIFESRYHIRNTEQGLLVDSIRLRYNRPVALDGKGNLVTAFDNGNMVESAPIAWQEVGGEKHFIDAAFVLHGKDEVGFALGDCLPGIPVIIDPVLTWNTFLGGAGGDRGFGITTDDSGNVYVTGNSAASWGSPRRGHQGGSTDAFAAKIDGGTGVLVWNTFLGGAATDAGAGIAVDGSGNVYVVGFSTASWQGASPPVRAFAGNSDAFVARLDSSGNLVWNTFLGGGTNDFGYAIVLDGSGNIYVTGESHATSGSPRRSY
ncbi:MAG: hypothetical protein EOM25_14995, partial [Deltaproteobacteria bacterium]|nr:hypothetical protein [Deltaproteobacteria bacterium]